MLQNHLRINNKAIRSTKRAVGARWSPKHRLYIQGVAPTESPRQKKTLGFEQERHDWTGILKMRTGGQGWTQGLCEVNSRHRLPMGRREVFIGKTKPME